ncbi:unnamed protein product [Ceutorhynchus assimilis]|uniref:Cyclin-L1 n=1 Tax=Ceutorhynchus assimilis TaxID=467358 RepID=A0A9N9MSY9_9CUCU|nr:unnamed protein product [Ceutorhynchus assimilis]
MGSKDEKKEPIPLINNAKLYGQVLLTLTNQLLPEENLTNTPSQADGLGIEAETDLRIYGCELIQTAGILLKLPQVAMATGQVLLQRFYYSKSLVRHLVEHTAMACVSLASKIEEAPRRVRDVVNVFTHIRQVNSGKTIQPVILDQNYIHLKNLVIKAERRVLKELGFCVHIKHPHKIIVMYLQVLGFQNNQKLMQYSWNYMNDSLRTDVFMRHQPETVACACIYLTSRKLKLPLPKNPHWYTIFGATEKEIRDICIRILKLYNRPKPNIEDLEKQVDELCEKYKNVRAKAKAVSGNDSPSNNGQEPQKSQKTSAHNAWGGFISRSGSHMPPPSVNEKRSRSKTRSPDKRHKKVKKQRSRTRSPKNHKKASHKRKSYSRSRSKSPKAKKRDRKRSNSNEREAKKDRYIDRYDDKDRKYKDDRDSKHKEDRDSKNKDYKDSKSKEDKDSKYKENKDTKYKEDRDSKYREDRDSKYKEDRDKDRYDRRDRDSSKYDRDEKHSRDRDDKHRSRDDKYSSRDRDDKYSRYEKHKKSSKHRDSSESRSKDRRRRS